MQAVLLRCKVDPWWPPQTSVAAVHTPHLILRTLRKLLHGPQKSLHRSREEARNTLHGTLAKAYYAILLCLVHRILHETGHSLRDAGRKGHDAQVDAVADAHRPLVAAKRAAGNAAGHVLQRASHLAERAQGPPDNASREVSDTVTNALTLAPDAFLRLLHEGGEAAADVVEEVHRVAQHLKGTEGLGHLRHDLRLVFSLHGCPHHSEVAAEVRDVQGPEGEAGRGFREAGAQAREEADK
mmetsp:Transcript_10902/g.34087  ORF Transcript_10902/g.34087 Transcript_10902/m.34087 type:complete len:240 (-) Transcript_10902:492-1211(-)